MSRAEALKAYLKVKDMDTLDESTLEEPFAGKETLGMLQIYQSFSRKGAPD